MAHVQGDGCCTGSRVPAEPAGLGGQSSAERPVASVAPRIGVGRAVSLALAIGILTGACGNPYSEPLLHQDLFDEPFDPERRDPGRIEVQPPPFSDGVFPCTDCHEADLPVKGVRRQLMRAHQDVVLEHDEENRWCLDCHSLVDFDKLHLASGELIDFEESYKLCGQCHGDKYRDWRSGIHGRRSGNWDGEKSYLLCVHCHYSHAPAFQPIVPEAPPQRPVRTP